MPVNDCSERTLSFCDFLSAFIGVRLPARGRRFLEAGKALSAVNSTKYANFKKKLDFSQKAKMEALAHLAPALRGLAGASNFDELVTACAGVAAGRLHPSEATKLATAGGASHAAQEALVALFLEATRTGGADEVAAALAGVLPEARAAAIGALAVDGADATRGVLDAISLGPDQLVGVTWERAVVIAAGGEQPRPGGTPLYTVTLTTQAPSGATKPVQFTASVEQLASLVGELKAAMRQVERESQP